MKRFTHTDYPGKAIGVCVCVCVCVRKIGSGYEGVSACACVFDVVHAICSAFIANQLFPPLPPLPPPLPLPFPLYYFSIPTAMSCGDLLSSVVDMNSHSKHVLP